MLGKLPVLGPPTVWITVGQGPTALAVGAGGGCLDIFTLIYLFFSFSLSLGDGPIKTEILSQRAVKPKTTNQPTIITSMTKHVFLSSCHISLKSAEVRILVLHEKLHFKY